MLKEEDIALVRQSVTMADIAGMYGYHVTRSGFMICPFHRDKNPSMKVYGGSRGYYCFVCNKGGDVIDFVRSHDNLDFEPAVRLIADHFGIAISDGKSELTEDEKRKIAEQREKREADQKARKANEDRLIELSGEIHRLKELQADFEPLGGIWTLLQKRIEAMEAEWDMRFENNGK